MTSRFFGLLLTVLLFAWPGVAHAKGGLRIAVAASLRAVVEKLVADFRLENPAVAVSIVPSTSGGVAALSADAADVAIVNRRAWELERRPFRQIFGHEPLGFVVGQSANKAHAPAVYVNSANPVKSLTLDQVARIFGTGLGTGDIRTWGQAGVQGRTASLAIHPFGLPDDGGFATNFRLNQMQGVQFAHSYQPMPNGDALVAAVNKDAAGIALIDTAVASLPPDVHRVDLLGGDALATPIMLYVRAESEANLPPPVASILRLLRSDLGKAAISLAGITSAASIPPPPNYRAPDGAIRIMGTNTMEVILSGLNARFAKIHPKIRFAMQLHKGLMASSALAYGTSAFVPMPRELTARETDPYRALNGTEPLAIRIAHGSIVKQDRTATLSIYVNATNPIASLTSEQVTRIFSTGHPKGDITHWGQLGMTGRWARLAIHPVGMPEDSGFGSFMAGKFSDGRRLVPNQTMRLTSVEALDVVGGDEAAIAYSATNFATSRTRAIPIAPNADSQPLAGNAQEVMSGAYALDRYIYLYIRKLPGQPVEPWLKDYLRFVLSLEGQAIIAAEPDGFLPLNDREIAEELAKLEGI